MKYRRILSVLLCAALCVAMLTPAANAEPGGGFSTPDDAFLGYIEALGAGDAAGMLDTFAFEGNSRLDSIGEYIGGVLSGSPAAGWTGRIDDVGFVPAEEAARHFGLKNYDEMLALYMAQMPAGSWKDLYALVSVGGKCYLLTMICVRVYGRSWYNYDINAAFAAAMGNADYGGVYPYDLEKKDPLRERSTETPASVEAEETPAAETPDWNSVVVSDGGIENAVLRDNGDVIYYPAEEAMQYDAEEHVVYFDNVVKAYLRQSADASRAAAIAQSIGGTVVGHVGGATNLIQIGIPQSDLGRINELSEQLMSFEDVLFAGYEYPIEVAPDAAGDPWNGDADYDVEHPGGSDWYIEAINAPAAWDIVDQVEGRTRTVYPGVVDFGFHTGHPDLLGRIRLVGTAPIDSHGTMIAGVISANADNNEGARGILTDTDVYCTAYSVSDNTYGGIIYSLYSNWNDLLTAGALVINNSFGMNTMSREKWQAYAEENNYQYELIGRIMNSNTGDSYLDYLDYTGKMEARTAYECAVYIACLMKSEAVDDFMFVQSAGNGYKTVDYSDYPHDASTNGFFSSIDERLFEAHPELDNIVDLETIRAHTMIVGAVENSRQSNENYVRAGFSNYGGNVDIWAPGKDIYSCLQAGDGLYGLRDGTSCAAPIVTASLVLLMNLRDGITAHDAKDYLINNGSGRRELASTWMDNTCPMLDLGAAAKAAMGAVDNNGSEVVGYQGEYYYWKYNAGSFAGEGPITYFSSNSAAVNELVRRDREGRETVLARDTGGGCIYISNNMVFYQSRFSTWKAVSPEGRPLGTFDDISVIGVDDISGNLIYRLYSYDSGHRAYMLDSKLKRISLLDGDGGNDRTYYGVKRGKLYYGYITNGTAHICELDLKKETGREIAALNVPVLADQYYDTTLGKGYIDNANLYVTLAWYWGGTGLFCGTGGLYRVSLNEGNAVSALIDYDDGMMTYDYFTVVPTESSDRRLIYFLEAPGETFAPTLRDHEYQPYYDAGHTLCLDTLSGAVTSVSVPFVPVNQFCFMAGGVYTRRETDPRLTEIVAAEELSRHGYSALQDYSQDYVTSIKNFCIVGGVYFFVIQEASFSGYGAHSLPQYDRIRNTLWMVEDGVMTEVYSY